MAEWSFGCGSGVTGYLYVAENWNNSTQVSYHIRLRYYKTTGAYNNVGDANYNLNVGGQTGSGNFTYTSATGWRTLWESDRTYNKDANGNLTINCYGYINGANSPLFAAGSTSNNISPARIGVAPTISWQDWQNVEATTATIRMYTANYGLGTSVTDRMYYKKTTDSSWTSTSDQSGTGTKSWNLTGLVSNESYHTLARAINNNGDTRNLPSSYPSGSYLFTTKPLAPVASAATNILATSATIPTTQDTGGGELAITKQYRIKETGGAYGSWTTYTGDNIDLTGLLPYTSYDVELQSYTSAGTTVGAVTSFTTLPAGKLIYSDGTVKNAIPRKVEVGETTTMVNINIVDPA